MEYKSRLLSQYFRWRYMALQPSKHRPQSSRIPLKQSKLNSKEEYFKFEVLDELHAQIMAILFIASSFLIVFYFNKTVITILEASRIVAGLALFGFFLSYAARLKFRLSLLDGLFYGLFGTAPMGLALMLVMNAQCTETRIETYKVIEVKSEGSGFTYELEGEAYADFWHIRNLRRDEANNRFGNLQFTLCDGLFGYKVILHREMVR